MAATFLTQSERQRYDQIPPLDKEELQQGFYLTQADKKIIETFHGPVNRLAISLQSCLIRSFGFLNEEWKDELTDDITGFVSSQLGLGKLPPAFLKEYGSRNMTRSFHLQQILKHLGYRKWQPMDEMLIENWLILLGMEHDNERWLLEKLCRKLHQDKILRPAIGTLERIVIGIGERLHEETYTRLTLILQEDLLQKVDALLNIDPLLGLTPHRWLNSPPVANTQREINKTMGKLIFLKTMGVDTWDLSLIPANRRKRLADIVRNNSNAYLQRIKPLRRYPLLICFLWETMLDTTDSLLTMYNDFWQHAINDAKKVQEEHQLDIVKSQNQAVQTLTKIAQMVMDEAIEPEYLRLTIFKDLPKQQLQEALNIILKNNKVIHQTHLFFLLNWHQRFRSFVPNFLKTLNFEMAFLKDNFSTALALIAHLQNGTIKKIPQNAPTNFITQSWEKLIISNINTETKVYELCVLSVLRDRLLSGDVFVRLSRKFADFNSFLIPKERWQREAKSICHQIGSLNIAERIDEKVAELTMLLKPLSELLDKGTVIRLEDGDLVVPPIEGEAITESTKFIQKQINERLPKVGLVEIIREVDSWVTYSGELNEPLARNSENTLLRYAALLGNGCNLSLADLARSSDLDYRSLWWVANNYFSDENLKRANDLLVNFHHQQWVVTHWGGGTLSSSDGQRFPTSGKIRNAQALPRYFGYGKGVTFYTHTSDQYSQYGTKVIGATERDATYVLDEILSNETDLDILEHTTDTHGYSDLLFALFDLVDKSFAPRIRDIKDQRLCKIKTTSNNSVVLDYPALKFTGVVNIDYLKKHADELQRVAASLLTGTVTASLLINKLQSYPRQNNLMYILQAYGQLIKTIFICNYLLNLTLRQKINAQLNKGEQLHNLRLYLWFGGDGIIRKKQEKEQQVTARSLNLITNIVLVWNTIYIQQIIKQLRDEGSHIDEDDLRRISPAPFEHINRLGKYDFKDEIRLENNGFRALRIPGEEN
jgi:TnpA family transposase